MLEACIPTNDDERLEEIYSLNILDTEQEDRFDVITRLARRMFKVPIAFVSIIDADRQWFKSEIGLNVTELPRNISFCGHAINGAGTFFIDDASLDDRFSDNPLVTGPPHIRTYAGCPIILKSGAAIGAIAVIDTVPRSFSVSELESLKDLATIIEREINISQISIIDDLTLLYNRRGLMAVGGQLFSSAKRQNKILTSFYFDLSKFKHINDTYGHDEGDYALRLFASVLRKSFRASDVIARNGGDEFAVISDKIDPALHEEIISRIESNLKISNQASGKPYEVKFNVGVENWHPDNDFSFEDLLKLSDKAMYVNKRK